MNFLLTSEQQALKDLAQKSALELLGPIVVKDEETGTFRPEIIRKFGELGLTGVPVPEAYAGAGLGYLEYAMMLEEIAAVCGSYAISLAVSGLPQVILNQFGSEAQKKKYIPPLARGEHIGAFALTESHAGSDAAGLQTRAEKKGDEYIVSGTKQFITQGSVADTLVVFARTDKESARDKSKGISAFIVEKGAPGLKLGKLEKKMGANISPTCEMIFEEVRVSEKNLIGKEGLGFKIAMMALDSGRITIGASSVGLSRAAFEYSSKYARERKQFGLPLAQFQGIQFMLADMYTQLEASRLMVLNAAFLKDKGLPFSREASAAKLYATDASMEITTNAVQILGGAGYMKEYPVERYMREAKVMQIVEGTNQIQRMVIGRSFANV